MIRSQLPLLLVLSLTPSLEARAQLELPRLFSDGMVLQRDLPSTVWGWDAPSTEIHIEIAGQRHRARAGEDGSWRVQLEPLAAGGPHRLVIQGSSRKEVEDVLVGEVWLGSGQSNMAMWLQACDSHAEEAPQADYPSMRMFRELSGPAQEPQRIGRGRWVRCQPETVGGFSGLLYHFGKRVQLELGVPVGLIDSSMSGTPIESWTGPEAQRAAPALAECVERQERADARAAQAEQQHARAVARWRTAHEKGLAGPDDRPPRPAVLTELRLRSGDMGGLFMGKIAPLIPYRLRGILWYQGEANAHRPELYAHQLPVLIADWRGLWEDPELPFAWVQLPGHGRPGERTAHRWPIVREAMRRTLALPATGMAIAIDVGEQDDIHPRNKRAVGERLAAWALGEIYGRSICTSGPLFVRREMRGRELVLHFESVADGLEVRGEELRGFEIADAVSGWLPAQARVEGATVVLCAEALEHPQAARYAWANFPSGNLYNSAELAASPFTTGALDGSPPRAATSRPSETAGR